MTYTRAAVERAMKVQEVILRALSGRQSWLQVADVLGVSPRTVRRLRWRYQQRGYDGLFDRRRRRPSPRCAPLAEVQRVLQLYRERYQGFNVRHFSEFVRREHGVTLSYTFIKQALQGAGLVAKRRPRGRHRRRREPRPCFGELLHLDGSEHPWLALVPHERQTLIAVLDDATKRLLYAELSPDGESTTAVMRALGTVFTTHGLSIALYTDRAGWAVYTPTSGSAPDRTKLTQVGRALAQLGIEHILSFSPQARGRSERGNRTLQDRLVNELRLAGITTLAAATSTSASASSPAGTRPLRGRPRIPPPRSSRCAASTWSRFSVMTRSGWWRATIPSASTAWSCRSPSSRAGAPVPIFGFTSAGTWTGGIPSGAAPGASGSTTLRASHFPRAPPPLLAFLGIPP
jgi:transposase